MKPHYLFTILSLIALTYSQAPPAPVIGIVSYPSDGFSEYPIDSWSYFSSSYVKFIESGGAQVIPIQYDLPKENITALLGKLNGVFFTGGGNAMVNPNGTYTPVGETLHLIVEYVVQQNQNGTYYPIWGTCMGFQAIGCILDNNFSILTADCDGCDGICKNNTFNDNYQSRLFAQLPDDLHKGMTDANLTPFFHHAMFHADTFQNAVPLNTILTPITFSHDLKGVKYISSYESPHMPIYATQFHQEVPTYQWREEVPINHSPDAIRLQQYLSKFFVNETKKNPNTFPDQQQYLIENHSPVVVLDSPYTSVYFFPAIAKQEAREEMNEERLFLERSVI